MMPAAARLVCQTMRAHGQLTAELFQIRGSLHEGQIGPMEQLFCWEVLYNHYVLHVGA